MCFYLSSIGITDSFGGIHQLFICFLKGNTEVTLMKFERGMKIGIGVVNKEEEIKRASVMNC